MNVSRILFHCWFLCPLALLFSGCNVDDPKKKITRIVTEWQDKQEIAFTYNAEGGGISTKLFPFTVIWMIRLWSLDSKPIHNVSERDTNFFKPINYLKV